MTPLEKQRWIKSQVPLPAAWKPEASGTGGSWCCPICNIKIAHASPTHPLEALRYDHAPFVLVLPGYTRNAEGEAIRPKRKKMWQTAAHRKLDGNFMRRLEAGKSIPETMEKEIEAASRVAMLVADNAPGTYLGDDGATGYSNKMTFGESDLPVVAHCHSCARRVKIKSVRGSKKP